MEKRWKVCGMGLVHLFHHPSRIGIVCFLTTLENRAKVKMYFSGMILRRYILQWPSMIANANSLQSKPPASPPLGGVAHLAPH